MKNQTTIKLHAFILFVAISCFFQSAKAQWTSQASGFTTTYRGCQIITAINEDVVWAENYDGFCAFCAPITEFTRTTDGGNHWIPGSITEYPNDYLVGLSPVTADIAFAITTDASLKFNRILKTVDGGATWSLQKNKGSGWIFSNIHFFNENDGLVFGDQSDGYFLILTTQDGGAHWKRVPKSNLPAINKTENSYIFSGTAIGDTFWTVSTEARIWRTVDKGLHWTASNSPVTDEGNLADVSNIKMRDSQNGLWGFHDELYRTSDGGITWIELEPEGTWFTNGLSFVPGTASTWVSTGGDVNSTYGALHGIGSSYSIDDGDTWILIDTGVDHLGVDFVNSNVGYCGGFNVDDVTGGMFKYNGSPLKVEVGSEDILIGIQLKNYPNPFSTSTTISFFLPQAESVSLRIYDLEGKLIRMLADEDMSEGEHTLSWDAQDDYGITVNAGIYLLQIQATSLSQTVSLEVVK